MFLHGFAMDAASWDRQLYHLASNGFRSIAYDKRGHGDSDRPWGDYSFDRLADDLHAVLTTLDLESVVLVGHSMGCGEIVRYLTRHGSARVARIVLVAPTTPFLLRDADNPDGFDASYFNGLIDQVWNDAPTAYLETMAPAFFSRMASPAMVQWAVATALGTSLAAVMSCVRTYSQGDFRDEIGAVSVPTLILQGSNDLGLPLELTGEKTRDMIPGSELRVYEGGPHALFITHRDQLNRDLLSFINS